MSEPEKPPTSNEGNNQPVFLKKDSASSELSTNTAAESVNVSDTPSVPSINSASIEYAQLVDEPDGIDQVLTAEIVPDHQVQRSALATGVVGGVVGASIDNRSSLAFTPPPPIPEDLANIASNGGAVAALVLGSWAVIGSFLTPWAVINAYMGVPLGIWGLGSRKRNLAILGLSLCLLAKFMWGAQVSSMFNMIMNSQDPEL